MQMCKSQKREQFSTPSEGIPGKGYVPHNDFNPFDTVNADFSTNGFNQDNQDNQNSVIECENNYNNLITNNYEKINVINNKLGPIISKIGDLEIEKGKLDIEKDKLESEIQEQELNIKLKKSNLESCNDT